MVSKLCEATNKSLDADANNLISQIGDRILKIAQSFKEYDFSGNFSEVKLNFQEFSIGMKDINIEKVFLLSKKIEKTLARKIEKLKEHV